MLWNSVINFPICFPFNRHILLDPLESPSAVIHNLAIHNVSTETTVEIIITADGLAKGRNNGQ